MPLVALDEFWEEGGETTNFKPDFRRGSLGVDVIQERDHDRMYQAQTDDATMSTQAVLTAALAWAGSTPALPALWSLHPDDPIAKVVRYRVSRNREAPEFHTITVGYETAPKPIDEPADIEWSDGSIEFVLTGAYSFTDPVTGVVHVPTETPYPNKPAGPNYPITISTRQTPDPPPVTQEHYRILTVRKNFEYKTCPGTGTGTLTGGEEGGDEPDPEIAVTPPIGWETRLVDRYYSRRINSVAFVVPGECVPFAPGTVFLAEYARAKLEWRNNRFYWATTWVFWIRERGWDLIIADLGFHRFAVPSLPDKGLVPIYIGLQQAQNPQRLDGRGNPLGVGLPPVYLRYRIYDYADFNDLHLFH